MTSDEYIEALHEKAIRGAKIKEGCTHCRLLGNILWLHASLMQRQHEHRYGEKTNEET